jgi:hypothetical protein
LVERDINPACYELEGRPVEGAHVLEQQGDGWHVFYTERGETFNERVFASESDACEYFLKEITKTESTTMDALRKHPPPGR